jgi:glycosyltransferase involved in cell wall biosynthesis
VVPGVLMLTGVYYPEVSGASLQCRSLIAAFGNRVRCRVLTTTSSATLPRETDVDGVPVQRVLVDLKRHVTKLTATVQMIRAFVRHARRFQIVHLHGFSQKSALLMLLARTFRKRVVVKMSSVGHDDPVSLRARHPMLYRMFARADRVISISPAFEARYDVAGLPVERLVAIPNGVDLKRFAPATRECRLAARRDLGLADVPVVLCVGFFSAEKQQEVLFDAWLESRAAAGETALVFAGARRSTNNEVDPSLADRIVAKAGRLGVGAGVHVIDETLDIERLYRAADVFVLPSSREGAPNVVLEAMACGLPCIVARLPGVTDALIDDGQNGILVEVGDRRALAAALTTVLGDDELARRMGACARQTVERSFSIDRVADRYLEMYKTLCAG